MEIKKWLNTTITRRDAIVATAKVGAAVTQGAWTRLDGNGVDVGGCINTLTSHHPSPLAKGNPQHTNLVEIKRA